MEFTANNWMEQAGKANQTGLDAALRMTRLMSRTQGQLMRQQLAWFEALLGAGQAQFDALSGAKDPADAFARQVDAATKAGERLMGVVQETLDLQAQTRDELSAWFEEGVRVAKALPDNGPAVESTAKKKAAKKAA